MWIKPDCGYQPTPPRCIARALVIASDPDLVQLVSQSASAA
jgi:hypothetical protein